MASVIASPRQEFAKKLPALPVIEHPALRRSEDNGELQIRGSSREERTTVLEEGNDALPPLNRRIKQQAWQGHSRVLTWPLGKFILIREHQNIRTPHSINSSAWLKCKSTISDEVFYHSV